MVWGVVRARSQSSRAARGGEAARAPGVVWPGIRQRGRALERAVGIGAGRRPGARAAWRTRRAGAGGPVGTDGRAWDRRGSRGAVSRRVRDRAAVVRCAAWLVVVSASAERRRRPAAAG